MLRHRPARLALALVLVLLAARLVYLVFFCPYTLVEDEAHYWEWSRRLELSYYTKGPGIAWTIAGITRLFPLSEWAIRIPAVLASAIAALAVARLASDASDDRRAPLYAVALFALAPIHLALGLLMTIDGPYLACWALGALFAYRALVLDRPRAWIAFAAALGVGFLFKYTVLLLLLGVVLAAIVDRRARTRLFGGHGPWLIAGALLFLAVISPVLLWNHAHDWPTVQHLLKHVNVEAAANPKPSREWSPWWPVVFVGSQVGAIGPAIALLALGVVRSLRERASPHWRSRRFLILAAAPVLVFYFVVSLFAEPEANWPLAGYASLFALAATILPGEMDEYRRRLRLWRDDPARPKQGLLRRSPETAWQATWHWTLGVGIAVAIVLPRIDLFARLPLLGPLVPTYRVMGADTRALAAGEFLERIRGDGPQTPLILSELYGSASHLAFYLPGRPVTFCARSVLGGERSQYDYFPDTDLRDPDLKGRNALLVGASAERWSALFDRVEPLGSLSPEFDQRRVSRGRFPRYQVFAGYGYHPPVQDAR